MEYLKKHPAFSGTDAEGLFQTLLDTAVDGVLVIDEKGLVLVCNSGCERLFGYARSEVLGRNVNLLMPEPYHSDHDGYLARYRKTGEKHIIGIGREVSGRRKDGSTFPISLSVGEGHLGRERIFVGIVSDVTDRARREGEIQVLQKELLHATRLTSAGQLSAALAHELNQPLTAILNYASALAEMIDWNKAPNGKLTKEIIEKIGVQTERAAEIIRRIRGFVEKREPKRGLEDLNKIVEDSIGLGLAGMTDIKLSLKLARDLPAIMIDKVQIQQVMINLLRNAAESMQFSETRKLTVTTARDGKDHVCMIIADTGAGIPESIRKRLFEPFVTTKDNGLGIGLSVCRTIIEAHQGRLWAESREGEGTVFRFRLPLISKMQSHE